MITKNHNVLILNLAWALEMMVIVCDKRKMKMCCDRENLKKVQLHCQTIVLRIYPNGKKKSHLFHAN